MMDSRIDEILKITSLVPTQEMKPTPAPRVLPKTTGKDDEIDYNYARENYYNLIERNQDAIIIMPVKTTIISSKEIKMR